MFLRQHRDEPFAGKGECVGARDIRRATDDGDVNLARAQRSGQPIPWHFDGDQAKVGQRVDLLEQKICEGAIPDRAMKAHSDSASFAVSDAANTSDETMEFAQEVAGSLQKDPSDRGWCNAMSVPFEYRCPELEFQVPDPTTNR
ncbi:hypothetical protein GGQ88_003772 [Novosphingobium hassiacum]|uniref:Uncharacterized protein n=1 Tax=Novosphingobium hassiacum TaxID=173676 RepID=A0A7W6EXN3_9SPHN|nr:hypothetical protein [Novosphingobium hassiacum]